MLNDLMSMAQAINPIVYTGVKWALDWNQMDEGEAVQYLINKLTV